MADKPKDGRANNGRTPNYKTRPDDKRGAPKGRALLPGDLAGSLNGGGRIGNPPFVATDEQRGLVRTYAKTFPRHNEHFIARLIGVSLSTLRKHFAYELEIGRAEMVASVGAQMINRAMDANHPSAKGDLDAQKFVLARIGGWTTKTEVSGPNGRAIETIDLSQLTPEQLDEYGRQAALAEGLDPEEVLGSDDDA
jgi:hypothetical protein